MSKIITSLIAIVFEYCDCHFARLLFAIAISYLYQIDCLIVGKELLFRELLFDRVEYAYQRKKKKTGDVSH